MARAFSTHPMTADRVRAAQQEIADCLPPRENYIVTTSEFEQVKARLEMLENRHHIDLGQTRPTLRQRQSPSQTTPPSDDKNKDDGRPTLRRLAGVSEMRSGEREPAAEIPSEARDLRQPQP